MKIRFADYGEKHQPEYLLIFKFILGLPHPDS